MTITVIENNRKQRRGEREMKSIKEKGFTLIEVMISLIILAIGILGVASMQIASIRSTSFSSSLTQASIVAQDSIESLKTLQLGDAALTGADYTQPDVGIFKRAYHVDHLGTYVAIRYTVSWMENNNQRNVSFTALKAR